MKSNTQQGRPDGALHRAKRVSKQAVRFSLPFAICLGLLALAGTVSCHYLDRRSLAEFFLSLVTIVLSSSLIRTATDRVVQSLQANDHEVFAAAVDSLLGNAAELCFVVIAVASGKLDIAKTALCGSLLANSLLTFGACLMVGGLQQKTLTYPVAMIRINAQLLIVNLFSVVLPTAFKLFSDESSNGLLSVSRASAVVLLVQFLFYFWFMQCSLLARKQTVGNAVVGVGLAAVENSSASMRQLLEEHKRMKKERQLSSPLWTGLTILPFSIAALAVASLLLLESLEAPIHTFRMSPSFLGLIIMPCVLASIDYVSGILRSKPIEVAEIAGEAFMSSIRISLLVFPLVVILGWMLRVPMDMLLDGFQVSVLVLAVLMANHVTHGEITHWLEGTMFIAAFVLFAVASAYYPNTA